jgi:hypothetical protein
MRATLAAAAKENNRRSLSEEILFRLRSTLRRDRSDADRPHIMALKEAVALIAQDLERMTERAWVADRYTSEQLSKGIELLIYTCSRGESAVPPAVAEAARDWPPEERDTYPAQLGEMVAGWIISLLKRAPEPLPQKGRVLEPLPQKSGPRIFRPEILRRLWQVEHDLKPRRQK